MYDINDMKEVLTYSIKYFVKTGVVKHRNNYLFSEADLIHMKIVEDLLKFRIEYKEISGILSQIETYRIESIKSIYIDSNHNVLIETDEYKFRIDPLEPYIVINIRKILDKIYTLKES